MNYHRASSDDISSLIIYPSDLIKDEQPEDNQPQPNEAAYQNPTVTESEIEENLDERVVNDDMQQIAQERESVKEEDIELDDGEQRYETEGEEEAHQTTLNDRILAVGSPLTPQNNDRAMGLRVDNMMQFDRLEDPEFPSEQDTMAEVIASPSDRNHNRSIAEYNQSSRAQ